MSEPETDSDLKATIRQTLIQCWNDTDSLRKAVSLIIIIMIGERFDRVVFMEDGLATRVVAQRGAEDSQQEELTNMPVSSQRVRERLARMSATMDGWWVNLPLWDWLPFSWQMKVCDR